MIQGLTALSLALLAPAQAQPAGEPLEVRFEAAVVPGESTTRVTGKYRLRLDLGAKQIPLLGLHFLGARIEGLEAWLNGQQLAFEARPGDHRSGIPAPELGTHPGAREKTGVHSSGELRSPLFAGSLRLPRPTASAGEYELKLSYTVVNRLRPDADAFDLVIPILIVDWPPTMAPPDMFGARVSLPRDFRIAAAFPTVARKSEDRDGTRIESLQLQVTPSVLRFRGSVGEAPFLTRGRAVDLGVGVFLLGLLAYGILQWRRTLGEADG